MHKVDCNSVDDDDDDDDDNEDDDDDFGVSVKRFGNSFTSPSCPGQHETTSIRVIVALIKAKEETKYLYQTKLTCFGNVIGS